MNNYQSFLKTKHQKADISGFECDDINPALFDYQAAVVRRSLKQGRFAIFADTGLGKSLCEMEWAEKVARHTGKPVLLLTPLAVARQFLTEGEKFGYSVKYVQSPEEVGEGINVTNYEKIHKFSPDAFGGIVIDESSCLKAYDSVYRKLLTEFAETIHYRLCATATPAPNDLLELSNHSEFLGILKGKEIIALFFTQDGNTTTSWRLKGHAKTPFYKWLASWAVAIRKPSDLGDFDDRKHVLPPINYHQIQVHPDLKAIDTLFPMEASTLQERRQAKRDSLPQRVKACAELVNDLGGTWVVWCELNAESEALTKAIDGAVELTGSQTDAQKEDILQRFSSGEIRVLVTKSVLAGFGLNWQHCHQMCFVGLSDSFEQQYQAIRRCWRFGQTSEVDVYYITSVQEGAIVSNVRRKEIQYNDMMESLVRVMKEFQIEEKAVTQLCEIGNAVYEGDGWKLMQGDCIDRMDEIEDNSVGLILHSPPFPSMYVYNDLENDLGNVRNIEEMIEHYRFLAHKDKMMRVLKPGRLCCVHLCQLLATLGRDGYIGLKDYRGKVIQLFEEEGWAYAGEVTIDKNPQVQATRNKERGLLFKSLATDSSVMRMALADYLIYFRKPGKNEEPIKAGQSKKYNPTGGWITEEEWIEWAHPVWYRQRPGYPGGIKEADVLNVRSARENGDERHLCPLQLSVIERAVKLWSNPGDTVLDPFNGIGSTGYKAIELHRKYIGIELKESYFKTSISNLKLAEQNKSGQLSLFA